MRFDGYFYKTNVAQSEERSFEVKTENFKKNKEKNANLVKIIWVLLTLF